MALRVKQFYLEEWKWFKIKFLKIFIFVSVIFVLAAFLSHAILVNNPEKSQKISTFVEKGLSKEPPLQEKSFRRCLAIFLNNLIASLISIFSGLIPFLFLSILGALRIGLLVGSITSISHLKGFNVFSVLISSILPHGIFELLAMLYSTSLGVHLTIKISKKILCSESMDPPFLFSKKNLDRRNEMEFPLFTGTLKSWVGIIVPLLILGTIIETFVTQFSSLYEIFLE